MRRIKSRNFMLIVCGVFFFCVIIFGIFTGMFRIVDKLNKNQDIYSNIVYLSSNVEVSGNGNFVEHTPKISGTSIENFNVKLGSINDSVKYTIKLCNMNEDDLIIREISSDNVSCSDGINDISCDSIEVKGYVEGISSSSKFKGGECINFIVEAKYVDSLNKDTYLFINKYNMELENLNDN